MDYGNRAGTDGNDQRDTRPKIDTSSKLREDITKESVIKIKRPQGGGTVRSIPIKDYQTSIAYNIGTLRRSMPPQLQFESLVSEPEKNVPMFLTKQRKSTIANNNNNNSNNNFNVVQKRSTLPLVSEKWRHETSTNQVEKTCPETREENRNNTNDGKSTMSVRKESHDFNDTANYFRRSYRRRLSSDCCNKKTRECCCRKSDRELSRAGHSNYSTRGHVGQKIIVYEENARRSGRNFDSAIVGDQRKHRPIGVPLVGMHNACGLPVLASWNETAEIFQPIRTTTTMIGNFGHVREGPHLRRRTHPKRRAPDPNRSSRTSLARAVKRNDSKRSTLRSLSGDNNTSGKKNHRRLSLKANSKNRATLSSKNSFKRTVRGGKYTLGRASLTNSTLDRKSFKGVAKRRTLYARDDGEEAVQALKNLCLNPLARNEESQEDMIW